MHFLALIDISS